MNIRKTVGVAVILLAFATLIALAAPWFSEASHRYSDWVYCENNTFIQHSWNTNWHHCPVAGYT